MSAHGTRKNGTALRWLMAIAFGLATWFTLTALHFRPKSATIGLSVAVAVIGLFSTEIATVALVLVASIPLLAVNALAGLIFLVVGLSAAQYLGGDEVPVLLVVAAAFVMAVLGPVWAVPVLAGYVLGSSRGALAAAVACAVLEAAGITLGFDWLRVVFVGGSTHGLVDISKVPENLFAFSWFAPAFKAIGAHGARDLWTGITGIRGTGALLLQPVAWALAAAVAGKLRRPSGDPRQLPMSLVASVAGVSIAALTSFAVLTSFRLERPSGVLVLQAAISVLIAALGAVVWDRAFKITRRDVSQGAAAQAETRGVSAEHADVDELLRLIATAEDKIANQHTTQGVVMITDMKSFSRMTEEEGSFVTAKAVQRHRDLLLPVIESHGGRGKSTGGDGLIATFDSAEEAVCAAREMQQTLERRNAAHVNEREILIRVGIAEGEVVLDKGGRPFIGAALNVAARVMSLGDGGQVLVTRDIASKTKAPDIVMVSHGDFELKNIAQPVEVLEVLWREGQAPCDPRTFSAPKTEASTDARQRDSSR